LRKTPSAYRRWGIAPRPENDRRLTPPGGADKEALNVTTTVRIV